MDRAKSYVWFYQVENELESRSLLESRKPIHRAIVSFSVYILAVSEYSN